MNELRFTRRAWLTGSALLSFGLACPNALAQAIEPPPDPSRPKVLVCLFLRGAVDGLSVVVPHAEPAYYRARPSIAISQPGKGEHAAHDLDGRFGLHPRLSALMPAWNAGELALVHAIGSPHPTRSHFEAQDYMESGTPGVVARDGWVGRSLALLPVSTTDTFRAVAFADNVPRGMRGVPGVLAVRNLEALSLRAPGPLRSRLEQGFSRLYGVKDDALHRAGREALIAIARARDIPKPKPDPDYPKAARPLAEVAELIKAGVGLRAAWIDVGGWDTHQGQGNAANGRLPGLLDGLGRSLAAFRRDLGDRFADVVVLTMSEFGRTVRQNGTGGTDHGHGTAMLVLGGSVKGKRVYGRWPGLEPADLHEGRDLAVTTDFRDLFAELARKHLGVESLDTIFPGYDSKSATSLGVLG